MTSWLRDAAAPLCRNEFDPARPPTLPPPTSVNAAAGRDVGDIEEARRRPPPRQPAGGPKAPVRPEVVRCPEPPWDMPASGSFFPRLFTTETQRHREDGSERSELSSAFLCASVSLWFKLFRLPITSSIAPVSAPASHRRQR